MDGFLMRTVRTNFDRQESRRDRRYQLPLVVKFGGEEFTSDNWSLGGFQITSSLTFEIGVVIAGQLHVDGSEGFDFSAQVVRKDQEAGSLGFHFQELSPAAVNRLDQALARRLSGRRRP
jgi:hypothetical protein